MPVSGERNPGTTDRRFLSSTLPTPGSRDPDMPGMIPKIPMRNAYHVVKTDDGWKIFFGNAALIPYNEDIPKLIEALQ